MKWALTIAAMFIFLPASVRAQDAFAEPKVHVVTQKWVNGYGVANVADITVHNDNPFAVKDITVLCTMFGRSGTAIQRQTKTIYDVVPAKGTRTFKRITLGIYSEQSDRGGCKVISSEIK
jgi:hypothetical protein